MKTILFQRRNALFSGAGFSKLVAVGVCIVAALVTRVLFPNAFITIVSPITQLSASVTTLVGDIRAAVGDSLVLAHERDVLRTQNAALTNENLTLTAKIDDLQALLASEISTQKGIVAAVLSRPPESPYDTLVIDAGSREGVSAHMRVFGAGRVPLGEVESVSASAARVTLYSSPRKALSAWIGKSRVPITLYGQGGGSFLAKVPKATNLSEGDIVYLAEGGAAAIAEVRQVESDVASPSAVLVISSLINPFGVVWVTLLP